MRAKVATKVVGRSVGNKNKNKKVFDQKTSFNHV